MSSWNHGRGPAPTGGLAESDRLDGVDAGGFRQDLQTAPESSRRFGVATRRYRTHHVRIGHSRQHGAGREGLRSSAVLQRGSPPAPAGPPSWRWSSPGRRSSRCAGQGRPGGAPVSPPRAGPWRRPGWAAGLPSGHTKQIRQQHNGPRRRRDGFGGRPEAASRTSATSSSGWWVGLKSVGSAGNVAATRAFEPIGIVKRTRGNSRRVR